MALSDDFDPVRASPLHCNPLPTLEESIFEPLFEKTRLSLAILRTLTRLLLFIRDLPTVTKFIHMSLPNIGATIANSLANFS